MGLRLSRCGGSALLLPAACRRRNLRPARTSGLPVPRFVSLKPDRVNVRGGPTGTTR